MIEVVFLGTSSMQPTKQRNHSSILFRYGSERLLFDCGEGTQRQLRIAGEKPAKISRIFLSHWHGDHVFGLAGVLSASSADGRERAVEIYGPRGTKKYVKALLSSFARNEGLVRVSVTELKDGQEIKGEGYRVRAQALKHSIPCLGYAFFENDSWKVDLKKAREFGVKGKELGELQKGKSVKTRNDFVTRDDVCYLVPGKKVGYIADTLVCRGAALLAHNADLLISEGTHLDELKEKTQQYYHMTIKQAALNAKENNAKALIITHISPRYKQTKELLAEAKAHFAKSRIAKDFLRVTLR